MTALFYLIVFLIPLNLGKHIIFDFSYTEGVLIDYTIPTLFIQDILVTLFVALSAKSVGNKLSRRQLFTLLLFFIFLALNIVFSTNQLASLYFSIRLVLYAFFSLFTIFKVIKPSGYKTILVLSTSAFMCSLLALGQWVLQEAVFNNYLFFGEQPYIASTPGILQHVFLGNTLTPPYSVFRHPNILGGFLSIVAALSTGVLITGNKGRKINSVLFISTFISICVVFLTFSYSAWVALMCGLFGVITLRKNNAIYNSLLLSVVFVVFVLGVFGFFGDSLARLNNPSFERRFLLTRSSESLFESHAFFGTGLNTNASLNKDAVFYTREVNFFQPVHNIFWLLLSEGGLLLFTPFIYLYLYALYRSRKTSMVLFVVLLQFIILGSFDHYLVTSNQALLLFLLTIGFSLNYTVDNEV